MMPFTFSTPSAGERMPVMAKNIVATSQPLAAQAGLSVLQRGGNAADAAIAAAITLTVVEPTSNGIGSDGFSIVWDGTQLHGLNASGRSPAAWTSTYFDQKYPELAAAMPVRGIDSVTIPGAVSQWVALSEKFGKLDFQELFAPAIGYARDGFMVSPITAASWARQAEMITEPDFQRDFTINGAAPKAGESWQFLAQANTLEDIADTRGNSFYRGQLAEKMVAHSIALGGAHGMVDFQHHQADWVGTIHADYHDVRLHEIPPNGQGLAALIGLNILENFDLRAFGVDSILGTHIQIEAMKLAFADAYQYIADGQYQEMPVTALLDKAYAKSRAALIQLDRASAPTFGIPDHGGTVYLTTADASGMMVSLIQSNYMGFGSGVVVPGTGIALQNRGHGFVRDNQYTHNHANCVAPNKRPFQTIIPGFLTTTDNQPLMSFGVMGGHMQPQGHIQMVTRIRDYGQNPQAASDAARWMVNPDGTVSIEDALKASIGGHLQAMGHRIATPEGVNFAYGGAQLIWRTKDGYVAGSDHRKDGHAVGY